MRYLPLTPDDRKAMFERIGVADIDALFADIPNDKRLRGSLSLPNHKSEAEVERFIGRRAARNTAAGSVPFFVGCGAYKHHIPATVDYLIQRSEFLTSYTPYQPEIAQGTLQYLYEFQTQVALLTGMEVANASMYDGSTAAAEAVLMAHRITKRRKAVLASNLHPHYRETIETVSRMAEDKIVALPPAPAGAQDLISRIDGDTSCIVVQTPDVFGHLHDLRAIADRAHQAGALLIAVVTEIVSLGLITAPGQMGADIVVAEGQSIGNALSFGGPYVGIFSSQQKYIRHMPGRLVGETLDVDGKRGFVLTLSAREQHIRREKATSNICTNSGLCALAFTIHLSLLGEAGLRRLARINHVNAVKLADRLGEITGVELLNTSFFNEFTIRVPGRGADVVDKLAGRGVLGGVPFSRLTQKGGHEDLVIIASTEVNSDEDRSRYVDVMKEVLR